MSRVMRKNYIGAFLVMLFALLFQVTAFAATKYEAEVKIPVKVTLEGKKASSEDVTITMTPLDGAPAFDQTSITVNARKNETVYAEFTKTFTEPVSYKYEVKQTAGTTDAYVYDDTVYTAVVYVENDDNGGLKASIVKVYKDEDPTKKQEAAEFVNIYDPADTDPPINKVVINDAGTAPDTVKFHFTMKADDKTYPMPEGSVDGSKTIETGVGSYEFGVMEYEKAGTYTYSVVENNDGVQNFTYDDTAYTVKVVVEKVNGKLQATRTITKGSETLESITFTNHYSDGSGSSQNTSGGSSTTGGSGSSGGSSDSDSDSDSGEGSPAGVLGAVRDAVENGPVGRVLGAAREAVDNSPVGKVLGAARGAVRTGDNSFMMVSAICFITAIGVLAAWSMAFMKRRMK